MPVDYANLVAGQEISRRTYHLDAETVSKYIDAVQDTSEPVFDESGRQLVAPMAVAALSLRGVIEALEIPGGTLHASQEFEFNAAVPIGETLDCRAVLTQNSVRRGWRFIIVKLEVNDSSCRTVFSGKSTITFPP